MVEADAAIFGEIGKLDVGKQVAKPVDIMGIYADPMQPRRPIPSRVRRGWNGSPADVAELLQRWWGDVIEERGNRDFPVKDFLLADTDIDRPQNVGLSESSFLELVVLASSIRRDKLTHPITIVRRQNNTYGIETGERRWLAYHLLHLFFPDEDWGKIPSHIVERFDVWRQASENSQRSDLNAIGRTRQLALLLMDLYRTQGATFQTFDELVSPGTSDRLFYAQVADGNEYRIPLGKSELLLNAMGLKHPGQLRHYRDLLRLPDEMWQQADDLNLKEGQIRRLSKPETVTRVTVSLADLLPPRTALEFLSNFDGQFSPNADDLDELHQQLDQVRRWINKVEKHIGVKRQTKMADGEIPPA
ncbi:MAG: ParB/RepB/Spo0J family partition protein [Aggregatilineales bacterium]